jgi:hypothetical protein
MKGPRKHENFIYYNKLSKQDAFIFTSTSPYVFIDLCVIKESINFTLIKFTLHSETGTTKAFVWRV